MLLPEPAASSFAKSYLCNYRSVLSLFVSMLYHPSNVPSLLNKYVYLNGNSS
jgi:hypothetical protein